MRVVVPIKGCTCDTPQAQAVIGRRVAHSLYCGLYDPLHPRDSDGHPEVLDLDADAPPPAPYLTRWPVFGVRMPAHLHAFIREQAVVEHVSMNQWMVRLIERARVGQLPADVRDWLVTQAAQCGHPGDPDAALVAVLRHLADRWPDGARLR